MLGASWLATTNNGVLQKVDSSLASLDKTNFVIALLVSQALLMYADYLSGPWIPFGVFYLLSLFVVVNYLGVVAAYVMAFFIVCGKTYVKAKLVPSDMHWWHIMWQFVSSYTIYTLFCYLLDNQLSARMRAEQIAILATNRAGVAERMLLNISEETQQRIGRELHDDLGQNITGIAFRAQVLSQKLESAEREEARDAEKITLMLNQVISKTRNMAHGLCPSELEEHDLRSMLEKFATHVEAIYSVNCDFSYDNDFVTNDQEIAIHLFRITQEAVNNAVRHGGATQINLRMFTLPSSQVLEIMDNGSGFRVAIHTVSTGLGMRSMRFRAELIGATLDISTRREGGTLITVSMHRKQ